MKKTNRLLSFILSGVMLVSTMAFTVNAQTQKATIPVAKYGIVYDYDFENGTAAATVSVKGGRFGVGRVGFSYDADFLTLVAINDPEVVDDDEVFDPQNHTVASVVKGVKANDYNVTATEETNKVTDLIDADNGNILFAWYTNATEYIDATNAVMPIATVYFTFETDNTSEDEVKNCFDDAFSGYNGSNDLPDGWKKIADTKGEEDYETDPKIEIPDTEGIVNDVILGNISVSHRGTSINVSWSPVADENKNVDGYSVEISDGTTILVTDFVNVGESFDPASNKYLVNYTNPNFNYGTTYTVTVTPSTIHGNVGQKATAYVTLRKPSSPSVDVSGPTSSSGAVLTYTVTFHAGEGTIPEGQKFKYTVALNGYVGGSPAVIAPEGKVFAGWSVDGVTLVSVEVYKITKNVTFKALYVDKADDSHSPFIVGYPGGEVRADGSLTRAEAATIIARASESFDSTKKYTANFSDVSADHWAANYIAFVYENNIVTGYEDNTYHPESNITRAEFATIMQRYLGIALNEDASFIDVAKDHWAVAYIGACKAAGLINGYENGEFRPANEITRAEAVKILNRAADRAPNPTAISAYINEKGIPFSDLDANKWYFYEIMEAAFPHLVSYYH